MVDVLDQRVRDSAEELSASGLEVQPMAASVADPDTARRAVRACLDARERLDIVVNNAAIGGRHAPLWELGDEEWSDVMAVNAGGVFNFCRAAVPAMIERRWGRIVNIASTAAKDAIPNTGHYSASKAAVVALTKVLAREVAAHGILVNAVTPGAFDTEIRNRPGADQSLLEGHLERVPLRRMGQPEEVARLVGFLVSTQLSYSTGAIFDISGGVSAY
jgi:3-oxoacyl-[acyl-carrier protein] reductase